MYPEQMDLDVHCLVQDHTKRSPHIRRLIRVDLKEGVLVFDGYYYASEAELPARAHLVITRDDIFEHASLVEITAKEEGEDTSQMSEIEEDDGSVLQVCFFPTRIITLRFVVLEAFTPEELARASRQSEEMIDLTQTAEPQPEQIDRRET